MSAEFKKFDAEYAIAQMEKIVSDYKDRCHVYVKTIGIAAKPFEFIKALEDLSQFYYASQERMRFLGEIYCHINGHGYILFSPIGDVHHEKTQLLLALSSAYSDDVLQFSRQFNYQSLSASSTNTEQQEQEQEPALPLPVWYKAHIKPAENFRLPLHKKTHYLMMQSHLLRLKIAREINNCHKNPVRHERLKRLYFHLDRRTARRNPESAYSF